MPLDLSFADTVARFYEPIHTQYHEGPTAGELRRWLARTYPSARGLKALDAGCGFHLTNSKSLKAAGFETTSIDLNPPPGATKGSVLDLPLERSSFDLVISTGVLHHTPDPPKGMTEVARVLKRGGTAYISLYCFRACPWEWIVRAWRLFGRVVPFKVMHRLFSWSPSINNFVLDHMYVPTLWLYRRDEVIDMGTAAGLELVEDFRSIIDKGPGTGDGLLRVFVFRKP